MEITAEEGWGSPRGCALQLGPLQLPPAPCPRQGERAGACVSLEPVFQIPWHPSTAGGACVIALRGCLVPREPPSPPLSNPRAHTFYLFVYNTLPSPRTPFICGGLTVSGTGRGQDLLGGGRQRNPPLVMAWMDQDGGGGPRGCPTLLSLPSPSCSLPTATPQGTTASGHLRGQQTRRAHIPRGCSDVPSRGRSRGQCLGWRQ